MTRIQFEKLDRQIQFGYPHSNAGQPSIVTLKTISDTQVLATRLLVRNGNNTKSLSPEEDELLRQHNELLQMAIDMYSNPWNFTDLLWWDSLSGFDKEKERQRCMENCENNCNAGGATMAIVCDAGAALLAPATLGWSLAGIFGCATFGVYYAGECKKDCTWRCR